MSRQSTSLSAGDREHMRVIDDIVHAIDDIDSIAGSAMHDGRTGAAVERVMSGAADKGVAPLSALQRVSAIRPTEQAEPRPTSRQPRPC